MRKKNGGFTLMELLIVVAIILVLAGAIVARIGTSSTKAKEAKAKAELDEIAAGCRAFYMDTTLWPQSLGSLIVRVGSGYDETAGDVPIPATSPWKGPYLEYLPTAAEPLPKDPWGADYVLKKGAAGSPGTDVNTLYAWSVGPATGSEIVIIVHRFTS